MTHDIDVPTCHIKIILIFKQQPLPFSLNELRETSVDGFARNLWPTSTMERRYGLDTTFLQSAFVEIFNSYLFCHITDYQSMLPSLSI